MPRLPYTNLPFPFYRRYSRTPSSSYIFPSNIRSHSFPENKAIHHHYSENNHTNHYAIPVEDENYRNLKQKNKSNKNDDYLFDLFGLKIYSDDVLLVSLIYFLYSEGVKDDGLFIVLILLLLS